MVNGVNGNQKSLGVLLKQKQKKLDSINQQKQAVQNEFTKINSAANSTKVQIGEKEVSLSDAIVALQNHPFKGMKAPDPSAPEYQIKKADGESFSEIDNAKFDADVKAFEKAEVEYKALEKNVETATEELKITKEDLTKIMAEAEKVEQDLAKSDAEYEVTMGDIEDLNKQIDEASKTETMYVALTDDKNNDTLVEATVNRLKDLQQQGLVDKNIDLNNLKPEQLKKLSEAIVKSDIKNGTVKEGTALDGTSKDYTKMTAGSGREYSVADMQEMAKALGADAENDEAGFAITVDDLKDLEEADDGYNQIHSGDKPAVQNQKPEVDNDKIVLPRGIKWQGTEGNKLSDFGITDNGDGTYTASTGKTYTASEVNKWFREVEDTVGSNYSKYLDKAVKLGIDYNQFSSSKELKEAVKAAEKGLKAEEKRLKAVDKYADEIKEYGINIEGRSANDIKAAVKAAKAKAKETTNTSTKVEVQKAESTPKKDQPAVQYEVEDDTKEVRAVASLYLDPGGTYTTKGGIVLDAQTVNSYKEMLDEMSEAGYNYSPLDFEDTPSVYRSFKDKQAEEAVLNLKTKTSTSTAFDDVLNGKGFEDFNARTYAKITANFKDGAKGTYDINGIRFTATQKVSESGTKAYLVNGEYYALRSDGMPDLTKKLDKAEFEK